MVCLLAVHFEHIHVKKEQCNNLQDESAWKRFVNQIKITKNDILKQPAKEVKNDLQGGWN